ncbi:hypothetical protein [Methylosinus trichosporium]|uniref:Porin n=3 Tax=Methylosinus TaxID=425 RepID=A0A2D2CZC1_METT3|nr:hypothetical protein [Methylosinus trichosporium]ATQ68087.1 hypothetical protein CQW49_09435 [Methylosinus trichosporium OB3b]OBS54351.1 hypothetical protein A8B73_01035 [Methylosinus sp. 3S-1]
MAELRALMAEIRELKAKQHALESRLDKQQKAPPQHQHADRGAVKTVKSDPPAPVSLDKLPGVTLTPGGFFAAESVYRTHWMGSDIVEGFQNIPFANNPAGHTDEFRFSARQSRLSLRADGDVDPSTHLTGYVEIDFLGAAQTANSNQTSSYNPRIRQLYTSLDLNEFDLHFLAGQAWTLATTNSNGIKPETILTPPQIDAQYIPGFVFARQPGLRITKNFGKEFSVAFAAEEAATTFAAVPANVAPGFTNVATLPGGGVPLVVSAPLGGGLYNSSNNYSFNRMPDLIAKVAWDPTILDRHIHVEGFGLLRDFTSRAYLGNHSVWAGGGGASVIVPVVPKLLDFQVSGAIGHGIGRYGASGLPDATTSITGAPLPIQQRMLLIGAIGHVTPQTDVYAFAGGEFSSAQPQFETVGGTTYAGGYGNWAYDNSGCGIENSGLLPAALTVCAGQTKSVRQLTGGFWHTLYSGSFGKFKAGVQYSYTVRDGFQGLGGSPQGRNSMIFTSIRYYPF